MTMLDERKPNGHAEPVPRATDARLAMIERRLAEIAEGGEQRVAILRDAIADFVAGELRERDDEIVSLKKQLADLQQKLEQEAAIDQRVNEISARLEEQQAQRDRGLNGINDGDFIQTMVIARESARKEFKAADDEMQRAFEAKLAALEGRLKSVPGRLPVAKTWSAESVTYEGELVSYQGALYQARKDTAQAPGGVDWACVARAGRDGMTPTIRGTYDVHEDYKMLDIVGMDGASLIAKHDNPGICPGDGWQLLSSQGTSGRKGETGAIGPRGAKGERGEAAPTIVSWHIEGERYCATPFLSDGSPGPTLDLRPLFEAYFAETSSG
jgi:hypothetical protein